MAPPNKPEWIDFSTKAEEPLQIPTSIRKPHWDADPYFLVDTLKLQWRAKRLAARQQQSLNDAASKNGSTKYGGWEVTVNPVGQGLQKKWQVNANWKWTTRLDPLTWIKDIRFEKISNYVVIKGPAARLAEVKETLEAAGLQTANPVDYHVVGSDHIKIYGEENISFLARLLQGRIENLHPVEVQPSIPDVAAVDDIERKIAGIEQSIEKQHAGGLAELKTLDLTWYRGDKREGNFFVGPPDDLEQARRILKDRLNRKPQVMGDGEYGDVMLERRTTTDAERVIQGFDGSNHSLEKARMFLYGNDIVSFLERGGIDFCEPEKEQEPPQVATKPAEGPRRLSVAHMAAILPRIDEAFADKGPYELPGQLRSNIRNVLAAAVPITRENGHSEMGECREFDEAAAEKRAGIYREVLGKYFTDDSAWEVNVVPRTHSWQSTAATPQAPAKAESFSYWCVNVRFLKQPKVALGGVFERLSSRPGSPEQQR